MKFSPLKIFILLTLLVVLVYSNIFSAPFLFDDTGNIEGNPQIRDLANFLDPAGTRYVGFLSFALNYAAGGLNVFGYHLVNVLIHVANGFLVYVLVLLLLRLPAGSLEGSSINHQPSTIDHQRSSFPIALFTALLFLVHPVQTQAVTYIVQRFASLVTLFYLLAVVCYLKWRLSQTIGPGGPLRLIYFFASLLSILLAMKTKENSLTLPLMILLVEWIFFHPMTRKQWLALVPFLLTLLIIPLSLSYQEPSAVDPTRQDIPDLSRLEYLFTQFRVIVTYLRLLVLPVHQRLIYDYPTYHSFFHPAVFVSFLFLLGLLGFAIRLIGRIGHIRLVGFGILWFFLTLSVESSIVPIKDIIFEHRVYLPSVGFFLVTGLVAASAWGRWKKIRVPIILLVLMIIGVFSIAAHQRNRIWRDPVAFWEDVAAKAPGKVVGRNNLGQAYKNAGRLDEALREYQAALRLHPIYPAAIYGNIGVVHKMQGRMDEAIRSFQTGLKLNADDAELHNNLGSAHLVSGRLAEAIDEYRTALRLNPVYPAGVHGNLGYACQSAGRLDEAIAEYQSALQLNPDDAEIRGNLGKVYYDLKRLDEAIVEYQKALQVDPGHAEAHNNLGNARRDQGRLAEAVAEYQTALKLNPNNANAHNNLGAAYQAMGRITEAIGEYGASLKLNPNLVEARYNLGSAYRAGGLLEEARAEFEEALKIRPDFEKAREALDALDKGTK